MQRDVGPSDPYHELLTPAGPLLSYLNAVTALLARLEPDLPARLETSQAIRNFGYGRCLVTQVVLHWNSARSSLGEAELLHYLQVLALAFGCELVDLWAVPECSDLLEPATSSEAETPRFDRAATVQADLKQAASSVQSAYVVSARQKGLS